MFRLVRFLSTHFLIICLFFFYFGLIGLGIAQRVPNIRTPERRNITFYHRISLEHGQQCFCIPGRIALSGE